MAEPTEETMRMVEASKQQIDAYVEALLKDSEVRAAFTSSSAPVLKKAIKSHLLAR